MGEQHTRNWVVKLGGLAVLSLLATVALSLRSHEAFHGRRLAEKDGTNGNENGSHDKTEEEGRLISFEVANLNGRSDQTGTVIIQTKPKWAPIGVKRFHELVDSGFFEGCR